MSHEDGRKSRCSEVTMMTNRSSHMPTLTISAMMNSHVVLVRSRLIHSVCGIRPLQKISAQYDHAYGPDQIRFFTMNCSYMFALYQPSKIGRASCRERVCMASG